MGNGSRQLARRCFFQASENITSERPIAFPRTLIGWCEWLRAPKVTRWQDMLRVGLDVTDGRNGACGADYCLGKKLLRMKRFDRAGVMGQGVVTLVLHVAEVLERVSLHVVWA